MMIADSSCLAPSADAIPRLLSLPVRPWRLHLETPGVRASVPMLRGVWGAALRRVAPPTYQRVFEPAGESPRYILRPALPEVRPAPAVEFILLGSLDGQTISDCWAAWDKAARMGLGPERIPFHIRQARPLAWDETPLAPSRQHPGFCLSSAAGPASRLPNCSAPRLATSR